MIVDSSTYLDQGPHNINFIDTYYIQNYDNYQDDKLLLRIYNYNTNMLESNKINNDNNNNKIMIMISMTIKCIKVYENIRNDYTITDKNNSKNNNNKLKKVLISFSMVHGSLVILNQFMIYVDILQTSLISLLLVYNIA
jgi:hypothetical protein